MANDDALGARTMTASDVRKDFGETINRVAYSDEPVVIERRGRKLAAIISWPRYQLFERLVSEFEGAMDAAAVMAGDDEKTVSFEKVLAEYRGG